MTNLVVVSARCRYRRPMANFTVFLIGAERYEFGGTATYDLLDTGAVQVIDPDNDRQLHFGPAAWSRIEESGGDYRIERSAW
ncbi:hypothetical protein JCM18899A_11700 [Nocardioides sp. AN3]